MVGVERVSACFFSVQNNLTSIKMDRTLWDFARSFWVGSPYGGTYAWLDLQRDREIDLSNGIQPQDLRGGEDAFPYFQGIPGAGIIMAVSLIQRRMRMKVRRVLRRLLTRSRSALMRGMQEGGVHNTNDLLRYLPFSQR